MNLEQLLAATTVNLWTTRRAIILDWDDGPRYGVCALEHPRSELFFHLFAQPAESALLAVRMFAISELPAGSVDRIETLLRDLGSRVGPVWVPIWNYPDAASRREIEGQLDALLVTARPTALLVSTLDWLHFDGCWNADIPLSARRLSHHARRP